MESGNITVDGTAKQIFGNVNSGEVKCGSIHVTGDADQILGNVADKVGEIKAGAITVSGDTNQIFGSIGAKVNTGVITVSGKAGQIAGSVTGGNGVTIQKIDAQNVTTQIFGAIQAETKITDGITVRDLKGNVFGTVSANVTAGDIKLHSLGGKIATGVTDGEVKLGNIELTALAAVAVDEVAAIAETPTGEAGSAPTGTTPPTAPATPTVGTLFGPITAGGKVMGNGSQKTIQLGDAKISSSLFEKVSGGEIHDFKVITTGDMKASLVGDKLAGNLVNLDLDCGSVAVSSSGILVSEMTSGLIEGCEVKAGNVVSTAPVFGGITGNVIAGEIRTSKVDVTSITVKAEELPAEGNAVFGGIAAEVKSGVKLTDNIVSADMNVTGKAGRLTVVGGIVGINNDAISGGNANVEVTYTQNTVKNADNTETHDQVRIGGIVGWMRDGKLSGTTAGGEIKLASGSGSGRQNYFIGGAVAYDDGVTYESVSTAVKLTGSWATKNAVTPGCPAGKGAVGMFVGYVNNGSFKDCSSTADNSTYQFLGEISYTENKDLPKENIFSSSTQKTIADTEKDTAGQIGAIAEANGLKPYTSGNYATFSGATFENCSFKFGAGSNNTFHQNIQPDTYFYLGAEQTVEGGYQMNEVTNTSRQIERYVAASGLNFYDHFGTTEGEKMATSYYYLSKDGKYEPVYKTVKAGKIFGFTVYTYNIYANGEEITSASLVSNVSEASKGKVNVTLYTKPQVSSIAVGTGYLITDSGTAYSFDGDKSGTAISKNTKGNISNACYNTLTFWNVEEDGSWKSGGNYLYLQDNTFINTSAQPIEMTKSSNGFSMRGANRYLTGGNGSFGLNGSAGTVRIFTLTSVADTYNYTLTLQDKVSYACVATDKDGIVQNLVSTAALTLLDDELLETTPSDGEAVSGETQNPNT